MSALSDLLNRAIGEKYPDSSNRDLAKLANVSRGTVDNYRNGVVAKPTEEVLQAFHRLLAIPIQELRESAGLPRGERSPYSPPLEANFLDERQRRALDELIRSIVKTQGVSDGVETTTEPDAPRETGQGKKSKVSQLIPRNPGRKLDLEPAGDAETLNPDDEVTEEEFRTAARRGRGPSRGEVEYEQHAAAGEESQDPEAPESGV